MYTPFNAATNRNLAIALIVIGVILAPDIPPFATPGSDVLITVPLSMLIASVLGVEFIHAVLLSYGLGFALMLAGVLIYPHNTQRLLNGSVNKFTTYASIHPGMIILMLAITFSIWWGANMIYQMGLESAQAQAVEVAAEFMTKVNGG